MTVSEALRKVDAVRTFINESILEREQETDSAIMSIISGASLLLIGDAGAGKTQHIQLLAEMTGLKLFDTLLNESTKPEAIFGPIDVPALSKGVQRTKIDGYAPTAELLFFDEVFKANGVVLNPMLWLLNEHKYRNGDEGIIDCPIYAVFAASNEVPTDAALRPIYDRFLIRHEVSYIKTSRNMHRLFQMSTGQRIVKRPKALTKEDVQILRRAVKKVKVTQDIWETVITTRDYVQRGVGVVISDRRMAKAIRVMQAHALLNKRTKVHTEDLDVLSNIFWDTPDQIRKVKSIVTAQTNSAQGDLLSYMEMATSIYDKALETGELDEGLKKLKEMLVTTRSFESQNGRQIHRDLVGFAKRLKNLMAQRNVFECVLLWNGDVPWLKVTEKTAQVWNTKQLRSVKFRFRRSMGYWWMELRKSGNLDTSLDRIEANIQRKLKCKVSVKDLGAL